MIIKNTWKKQNPNKHNAKIPTGTPKTISIILVVLLLSSEFSLSSLYKKKANKKNYNILTKF